MFASQFPELPWNDFKAAMSAAYKTLPELSNHLLLIWELRVLRKCASKPSTSTLLARDGSKLTRDDDKLQRRVEHFSDVVNYESEVSIVTLDALPVLELPSALSDSVCV